MTNKSNHKPLVAPPSNTPDQTYHGLRNFNLGMGVLHLVQGILMIAISNDTTYPIYTYFLFNTSTPAPCSPTRSCGTSCPSASPFSSSC